MVNRNLPKFNEGRAFAIEEQTISVNRRGGQPVSFVIQNNNFEKLTAILPKILEETRNSKVLQNADADLKRDLESKMQKLNRQTEAAIVQIIRK